jgi:hypothetical protein
MTHEEAQRECARLAAEHLDRETHHWQHREEPDGERSVVKINMPPPDLDRTAEVRAEEKPPTPDDPRPAAFQNIPPFGAA